VNRSTGGALRFGAARSRFLMDRLPALEGASVEARSMPAVTKQLHLSAGVRGRCDLSSANQFQNFA
jgi:hypothetical protein